MISAYHRPKTLQQALTLIARPSPRTLPLGGGTLLSSQRTDTVEVVDLQALGLNSIKKRGSNLESGATVTLQQLFDDDSCPQALRAAIKLEAPLNIRNAATLAGTLVSGDGRSTVLTALLALDSKLTIQPGDQEILLGNFLPLRNETLRGKLITQVSLPLNARFAFESVARTPSDKPLACAALARWPSGRTRLALGGFGKLPVLAMDGTESEGLEEAARNACQEAADEWAPAAYRADVAAILAKRCLDAL